MTDYPAHPAADIFPLLEGEELQALADDIKQRGLTNPVWLYEDPERGRVVLDGRNRLKACALAGVEPRMRFYQGSDPIGFSVAENLRRRHLTAGQRAFVGAEIEPLYAAEAKARQLATLKQNASLTSESVPADLPERRERESRERAAKVSGASGRGISQAKRVAAEAPDLAAKVRSGAMPLDRAEKEVKQREKAVKVAEIQSREPAPLDSLGPFGVIYADPPWRYDHASARPSDQIENHYPTMSLEEIKALPVPAANDSMLFMWVTSPKLAEGMQVLEAWGFDYRTCMVWVKDRIGLGYYARQQHELLLIAKRGSIPVPDPQDRPSSVFYAPRGEHSAKPDLVYGLIERMYPLEERCELFQRRPRTGWSGWGNQAEESA